MSFRLQLRSNLGALAVAFSRLAAYRRRVRTADRNAASGSPWRPCPGTYALLVDIHRQH